MTNRTLVTLASGLLALLSCSSQPAFNIAEVGTAANWWHHGGGADESGYSQLDEIKKDSIDRLGLAWSLDLKGEQILEATPLAVDGVLYFTGSYSVVYAVGAVSGKLLWRHDPEIWKHNPFKMRTIIGYHRGAAYADGRIFSGTMDGRLLALDAKTGDLLWSVETVDPDSYHTITGAPRTFNGKVIIGNGGADYGARGYVTAYDQKTGTQVWRFYTVPGSPEENKGNPAMELAAKTWTGEYWKRKPGIGGTVWNDMTFDPEFNHIYIGVGNSHPNDPEARSPGGGDNLFIVSIVALDADTGEYVWHYQVNPRDAWSYKAIQNMITATLEIDGEPRKVLMQAPSNGFFYVLDRKTGKLLSAEKTGKVTWAERIDLETGRPVEAPNIRYETGVTRIWPGGYTAHNWQDMSFSPRTGLVYIPHMQLGSKFTRLGSLETEDGQKVPQPVEKVYISEAERDGQAAIIAWDPVHQKERWRLWHDTYWNGGILSTAGDLVFQGTADGYFSAYDASTGERVWRFYAGLGILATPISYSIDGRQYISVLVGHGTSSYLGDLTKNGWKYGLQPRRLFTFTLDGKAELPPTAPPDFTWSPIDDPAIEINDADVQEGETLFARNCSICHGREAVSRGAPGPDLRESQMALHSDGLWVVLHEGTLMERGMPRFDNLRRAQADKIHAFIRHAARQALQ